jgi:predicted  nucleic acid-binding Zn-ribbon protein
MNMEAEMKEHFDKLETLIGKTADGHARLETLIGKTTDGQARLETLIGKTTDGHANLERLIVDVKESLETEMQSGFSALNTKLDDISIRLDRHAGLLRSGGQRIVRLDDWAEKVDKSLEAKDREIAELRERVIRLEQKKSA